MIFNQIIKYLPSDNNTFYFEHNRENNTFVLKEDKDQFIKDGITKILQATKSKLKTKDKTTQNKKELRRLRKIYIAKLREFGKNKLADNLK